MQSVASIRSAKTPDLLQSSGDNLDLTSRTKHVSFDISFDAHNLVRSNTIGAGLESEVPGVLSGLGGPFDQSANQSNQSHMRLLHGFDSVPHMPPLPLTRPMMPLSIMQSNSSLGSNITQYYAPAMGVSPLPSLPPPPNYPAHINHPHAAATNANYVPALRVIRRAVMKTQATQTEQAARRARAASARPTSEMAHTETTAVDPNMPEYLTLSPRRRQHEAQRRHSAHYHYNRHPYCPPHGRRTSYQDQSTSSADAQQKSPASCAPHSGTKSKQSAARPVIPAGTSMDSDDEDTGDGPRAAPRDLTNGKPRASKHHRTRRTQRAVPKCAVAGTSNVSGISSELTDREPIFKSHSADDLDDDQIAFDTDVRPDFRRHSIGDGLGMATAAHLNAPPPPAGFEDSPIAAAASIDIPLEHAPPPPVMVDRGSSPSSDSSRAVCSAVTDGDQNSTAASEIEELESSLKSSQKSESPTIVSDLSVPDKATLETGLKQVAAATIQPQPIKVTERPLLVDPNQRVRLPRDTAAEQPTASTSITPGHSAHFADVLNSPESECSSHITISTSSSTTGTAGHKELDEDATKGSGSSVYVTATEHSPQPDSSGTGRTGRSFETASSANASLFSSPSSSCKRKSSQSSGADGELAELGALSPDFVADAKVNCMRTNLRDASVHFTRVSFSLLRFSHLRSPTTFQPRALQPRALQPRAFLSHAAWLWL